MNAPASPLAYEQSGAGPPLLLIHGMAGDRSTWDAIAPALAQTHRVVRCDLRGFGASPADISTPYTHADDIAHLLDTLSIARCDLLGVSMGGAIALNFALEHPARVKRLVLESPSLKGWDWSDAWRERASAIEHAAQIQGVEAARQLFLADPLFVALRAHPEAFAAFAASVARYSGRHWLGEDAHAPPQQADVERLERLTAPTLLITGERDLEDIRLIAEAIAAIAPNVARADVVSAGHLVHLEQPDAFVRVVSEFLER